MYVCSPVHSLNPAGGLALRAADMFPFILSQQRKERDKERKRQMERERDNERKRQMERERDKERKRAI